MRNIHILATDKPSRLFIIDKSKMFISEPPYLSFSTIGGKVHKIEGSDLYQPQNICITSNEEIKEGDWCYDSDGKQILQFNNRVGVLLANQQKEKYGLKSFFKIILTTDQDLIKDGVQAIDDDFLEWFVKNPTCEFVETEISSTWWNSGVKNDYHKIIIPSSENVEYINDEDFERASLEDFDKFITKEESIFLTPEDIRKVRVSYVEPKEETLEEVTERPKKEEIQPEQIWNDEKIEGIKDAIFKHKFKVLSKEETLEEVGNVKRTELFSSILSVVKQIPRKDVEYDAMDAPSCAYEIEQLFYKWQAERSYSEEEIQFNVNDLLNNLLRGKMHSNMIAGIVNEWFDKFKKK